MNYISVKEASALWGIDTSNIGKLCRKGKIEGAKIVGRNWMIPKSTSRPVDGRTRAGRESQNSTVFRFPLYINFSEDSFVPPLSSEEVTLRQAQKDFYACEFRKSKINFEALSESARNIYVKICANFYMCVLAAEYDTAINWKHYYYSLNLLLSQDFPHKREMELFLPWLNFIIGNFMGIPELLCCDDEYEFHPSAVYVNAFLSAFNYQLKDTVTANPESTEPFGTLCRLMERDGYYIEAQKLHVLIFVHDYSILNKKAMRYHLKKVIDIAYKHNLLFSLADLETYYADEVNSILSEYPDSFAEQVRKVSRKLYSTFAHFAEKAENTSVYTRLSKRDYRYVFYAMEGFSNKQVAAICNLSERTVANRYNDIYNKMSVNSKQELVNEMNIAFGEKRN